MKIFISIASQESGQNWFSTGMGIDVWKLALTTMCSNYKSDEIENNEEFENEINSLFIDLIKKILFLNKKNADLFTEYITRLIKNQKTVNGYLHQIILQVLLDDQNLKVNFERGSPDQSSNKKCELFKSVCNSSLSLNLPHPRYATGSNKRLLEIQLSRTASDVLSVLIDTPMLFSNENEDINDALLGNIVDENEIHSLFKRKFYARR